MIRGGAKRRPRNERNIQKPADDSSMAEKRARLAEAKKDLEDAKKLEHTMVLEEATCAAEIDEEAPSVSTANFRPSQVFEILIAVLLQFHCELEKAINCLHDLLLCGNKRSVGCAGCED